MLHESWFILSSVQHRWLPERPRWSLWQPAMLWSGLGKCIKQYTFL
ncbi:MAG TPA: hypothetical protein VKU38_08840 [Ktedonobacteraceae bacterium]|nr:hypothetical protein [Ktedonobacteraceae bacterium]